MEAVLFAPSVYQPQKDADRRLVPKVGALCSFLPHIFRRLYRKGQSAANGYLVLYCRKNGSRQNRIGLTVSAKLAHAVHRNRLRRQLREIYRLHEAQFARGYDIVVVARTRAIGADYAALERAYLSLAAKLGLLGGQTA